MRGLAYAFILPSSPSSLTLIMFLSIPATKFKKRTGDDEALGRPHKASKSGRSISQQLYENVVHDTPWDEDLEGAPTGLNKEEESSIREMMPDVKEMARDADAQNGPVCWYLRLFESSPRLTHCVAFHCTLTMLSGMNRLHACESTTYEDFTEILCTMLSCPDPGPSLEFTLSTDPPESARWDDLNSPDDWDLVIGSVRRKRAQQKSRRRRSVNVRIRLSESSVSYVI